MECSICYTNEPTYVINCGSTVEHKVCDMCEVTMRMKEPATTKGRILKCPMCRVYEKVPGKRSTFSYDHELSQLYRATVPPVPRPAPVQRTENWQAIADRFRDLPVIMQHRYIQRFPQLAMYFENYIPHRLAREAAIVTAQGPAVAPVARPTPCKAFCQSGRRETGECHTRNKTKRKCTHTGCVKFVCRSCSQCLMH